MFDELTDALRHPLLDDQGAQLLNRLREHPSAPRFNWRIGDRMTREGLETVRAYERELAATPVGWRLGEIPEWLREFVARCYAVVPFYRAYGDMPAEWTDIPTPTRADLARAPELFVPDDLPLDEFIFYGSTGTTGHHIHVPSHPTSAAKYISLLRKALQLYGVTLDGGKGRVAIANVCFQASTATYAAILAQLDGSGVVKINLHPGEWNTPQDRAAYLNDLAPEIITGDPLSFAELLTLDLQFKPKALSSTSMRLEEGLRHGLQERFACPVVDVYAMTEAGPIAARVGDVFSVLQHRLYVEILDNQGEPCAPGESGEITLTGGMNPYFPLLRYRTNDFARLEFDARKPRLVDFQGRAPVVFRGANREAINSADVNRAMREFPVWQFTLHQNADASLVLHVCNPGAPLERVRAELLRLFGAGQKMEIIAVEAFSPRDKIVQYSTAL